MSQFPEPPNPVFPATYTGNDKDPAYALEPPYTPTPPTPATTVVGPDAFGAPAAVGVGTNFAREDHDHGLPTPAAIPAFAVPAIALGTAAAAGAAGTVIRSDATIVGFDVTVPVTQAFGDAAATGAAAVSARRDHKHGMPANPVVTPNIQNFVVAGAGVWNKPAGVSLVEITCIGGGGGGGSGRKGLAAKGGGGGGGGGAITVALYAAADLPASLDTHVGAGGTFGIAQVNDGVDGLDGSPGSDTWVVATAGIESAAFAVAGGGGGGGQGTAAGGGAVGLSGDGLINGGQGGNTSVTVQATSGSGQSGAGGGGGGGGMTAGVVGLSGGYGGGGGAFAGGTINAFPGSTRSPSATNLGGAFGAADNDGTSGGAATITGIPGKGGGGGGGYNAVKAGAGGAGGAPGGGGGGGGGGLSAVANSGAGAAGATGAIYIRSW